MLQTLTHVPAWEFFGLVLILSILWGTWCSHVHVGWAALLVEATSQLLR